MSSLMNLLSPEVLADLAIKSLAVMLLALLAAAVLGRASAAWRHLAWCLSLVALLLLPALSLALPAWRAGWLPQWPAARQALPAPVAVAAATDMQPIDAQPQPAIALVPPQTSPAPAATLPRPAASAPSGEGEAAGVPWIAIVWLAGWLVAMVPVAIGLWQLACLRRSSTPVKDPRWLALVSELTGQLGLRRSVQLRTSDAALVPLTWGALRPVLLIPADADQWSDDRRRLVLLHELAHIRRWDWLTQLVAHLACGLYWFNPLVWLAARQMRTLRERACDDLVLAAGAKPSHYAHELLALAAGLANSRLSSLAAVPMTRRGGLEDRLRGILDPRRSRAAATTAAICLAAALAAVAVAPLAMLRAAPPEPAKPAEGKPSDKPAQSDPTPEEIEARKTGIRITVLNSTGDKPIPEFRVLAGISPGSVTAEFERRTGQGVINWQPHTCRIGKDGEYVWPLDKAYAEMALRVEADGYQPQIFTGLKKVNGPQHIVFMLAEDKGVAGRVLTPAGRPAAGATVAMSLPHKEIVWEKGKLRGADDPLPEKPGERWRRPLFVKTDAEGAFRLPTELEPAAILVVHESGVRELAYDAWQKSPEIKLQAWGRIEGQILWRDKPGADLDVSLIVFRGDYGYPGMVSSYEDAKSDGEGRFTFERVLPGQVQISLPSKVDGGNITSATLNGMFQHPIVKSGEPTAVLLGGVGRRVTGKLAGLDSWEGVTYHFHPEAPHIGFPGDDAQWKAFSELRKSPQGPLLFRDQQPVGKDGGFAIENMLPGRYQLFVSAPGFKNYAAGIKVTIDPEVPGQKPADKDLGVITVKKPAAVARPAEEAKPDDAAAAAAKPAAATVTVSGKVVDDATGEPVGRLIVQGGKFDPADPTKVTWGYFESRSSGRDGSFSTTVRWSEGWTARIVAEGYLPQPVLASAPPAGTDKVEVTIRLKRGREIAGRVLDHKGDPLEGARVFAIGPTGLNLAGGRALSSVGDGDDEAAGALTDAEGRFRLPAGEAKSVAVTHAKFDAWPAAIPDEGELTIRLPEPARVEVELDIEGAAKECTIFYQLLSHQVPEFKGLQSTREVKIANPGKLSLAALPPGRYQLWRSVMNRVGELGFGASLDRTFFELAPGNTKTISYVRPKGARVSGKVIWPEGTPHMGTIVSVRHLLDQLDPFFQREWPVVVASSTAEGGAYQTERIPPGKYLLRAEGYVPLTPEQRFRTGIIRPSLHAEITIEVPAEGELTVPDLTLKPSRPE